MTHRVSEPYSRWMFSVITIERSFLGKPAKFRIQYEREGVNPLRHINVDSFKEAEKEIETFCMLARLKGLTSGS